MEDEESGNDKEEDEDDDGTNNTQPSGEEVFKTKSANTNSIPHIHIQSHDQILSASLLQVDLCLQADS